MERFFPLPLQRLQVCPSPSAQFWETQGMTCEFYGWPRSACPFLSHSSLSLLMPSGAPGCYHSGNQCCSLCSSHAARTLPHCMSLPESLLSFPEDKAHPSTPPGPLCRLSPKALSPPGVPRLTRGMNTARALLRPNHVTYCSTKDSNRKWQILMKAKMLLLWVLLTSIFSVNEHFFIVPVP